jgi:hypothetical protein
MVGDRGVVGSLRPAAVAQRRRQFTMPEPVLRGEKLAFGDEDDGDGMAEPVQA